MGIGRTAGATALEFIAGGIDHDGVFERACLFFSHHHVNYPLDSLEHPNP